MSKRARQILFGPTKTIGDEKKMIFRFKINKQCPTYFCKNGWRHRNPSWEFRNDAYLTRRGTPLVTIHAERKTPRSKSHQSVLSR
mmetsp:Transcript_4161/g.4570  ORF Transcript_4161/g.4570 Transcript_4161/m.4570 type:complete len:85 (+) Transcript_4161:58-312(+)